MIRSMLFLGGIAEPLMTVIIAERFAKALRTKQRILCAMQSALF